MHSWSHHCHRVHGELGGAELGRNAQREDRVPAGTGTSAVATASASRSYKLGGIESQLSPFVDTKVEVSGEVEVTGASGEAGATPVLRVGFIQKVANSCQ